MSFQEIQEQIEKQKKDNESKLQSDLLNIIPDAKEISFPKDNWIAFKSKGNDKKTKECFAKYDNRGIVTILKQIDAFKQMRFMVNGQPISNCKVIYLND